MRSAFRLPLRRDGPCDVRGHDRGQPTAGAGAAALGLDPRNGEAPVTSALVMTLGMAAGMAAWMWDRGHHRVHMALMSAAMFPPTIAAGALSAQAYSPLRPGPVARGGFRARRT